jgi:excisionase family DNA binding protein
MGQPKELWRTAAKLVHMPPRPARPSDIRSGLGDQLLTVEQAGEYLATGPRFIRRLITERRISYVKVGKYVRLERAMLDAFVDAGRVHSQR